jgi:hypothetical protein
MRHWQIGGRNESLEDDASVLRANGFPEAAEWIDQPHIHKELKDIAERARKKAVGLSTEDRDDAFGVRQ